MSTAHGMVNEDFQPADDDEDVLGVVRDYGFANPYLIREETGLGKGDVNTSLVRLTSAGWVDKITRGLYEFVDDPRRENARGAVDREAALRALEDLEVALEQGRRENVQDAIERIREAIGDA